MTVCPEGANQFFRRCRAMSERVIAGAVIGVVCLATAAAGPRPASAAGRAVVDEDGGAPALDSRSIASLQFENDALGAEGSDRHYSNGLRISWLTAENRLPHWLEATARALPVVPRDARLRANIALGHNIYTPEDIKTSELVVDDRPYAGWLHLDFGVVAETDNSLDVCAISLGTIGPAAHGEEVQVWFHSLIGSPQPQGWQHQLHDELTLMAIFEHKWRNLLRTEAAPVLGSLGIELDAAPHAGFAIGNVFAYGGAGLTLRCGNDLPADFGPPRIRPGLPGSDFFVPSRGFGWYLFAGLEARAVAQNIFLDGNTFRGSHSVIKEPLVGDLQAGIAISALGMRLAYTHVVRSAEFVGQREPDLFGATTLSVRF
jgi:hypothetical protein